MSRFEQALAFALKWEGWFSNHPNDPGGATNFGVTQKVYDAYRTKNSIPVQTVKLISKEEVNSIYQKEYWNPTAANISDVKLAISVFDFAVNGGCSRSLKYLKLSGNDSKKFNELREKYYIDLASSNTKLSVFLKGWLNRVEALKKYLLTIE